MAPWLYWLQSKVRCEWLCVSVVIASIGCQPIEKAELTLSLGELGQHQFDPSLALELFVLSDANLKDCGELVTHQATYLRGIKPTARAKADQVNNGFAVFTIDQLPANQSKIIFARVIDLGRQEIFATACAEGVQILAHKTSEINLILSKTR